MGIYNIHACIIASSVTWLQRMEFFFVGRGGGVSQDPHLLKQKYKFACVERCYSPIYLLIIILGDLLKGHCRQRVTAFNQVAENFSHHTEHLLQWMLLVKSVIISITGEILIFPCCGFLSTHYYFNSFCRIYIFMTAQFIHSKYGNFLSSNLYFIEVSKRKFISN